MEPLIPITAPPHRFQPGLGLLLLLHHLLHSTELVTQGIATTIETITVPPAARRSLTGLQNLVLGRIQIPLQPIRPPQPLAPLLLCPKGKPL
jgi:hypothetical protein